jgi:NADH-quinone oxidoreductase subunit E
MSTNATHPDLLIEPLSAEELAAIDTEIADLPDRPSAAIEALRIVQEHRGWVSDESLNAIARHLNMAAAELDSVATFYNLIFRKPVGRHVIMVCDSISCFIMGCDKVRQRLSDELGIEPGETTEDGRFTLLPIVCLGACDKAPTMTIDEELFGQVDPAELPAILERFE